MIIVSFGGGYNSTALLIEFSRRGLRPDGILFADTGGERPETYAHRTHMNCWLDSQGWPLIETPRGPGESLEANCVRRHSLPSLAFGYRTCSQRWKSEPIAAHIRRQIGTTPYLNVLAFAADEARRATPYRTTSSQNWYPLVEWDIDRDRCVALCQEEGFTVSKSACFFCPATTKPEVIALAKTHPDLLARALAMEAGAQLDTVRGLGRRWSWRELVERPLFDGLEAGAEMPCVCVDE